MNKKIRIIHMRSSILTTQYCIAFFLVAAGGLLVARMTFLAAFLILIAIVCFISRRWALAALKNVEFEAGAEKHRFFPDETFALKMRVKNEKQVPLVWLDVAMPLIDGCPVMPVDEADIYQEDGLTRADEELPRCKMLRKRFAFIMPWQKVELSVDMKATHRGIYKFNNLRIYSGDGFGLTQTGMSVSDEERVFAVYPKLRSINADFFLRTQWMSAGRSKGFMEEPTLIRGTRDYQPTDSWKRINWRMAARGLPLTVNLPEMILPQSSHFIVDGESFAGYDDLAEDGKVKIHVDGDDEGFELMLSLLCSIIIRLNDAGLGCGLTLPESLRGDSVTFRSGTSVGELLFALAAYEHKASKKHEDPEKHSSSFKMKLAKDQEAVDDTVQTKNADSSNSNVDLKGSAEQELVGNSSDSAYSSASGAELPAKPASVYDRAALLAACENAGTIYYLTKNIQSVNTNLIQRLSVNSKVIIMPMDEATAMEIAHAPARVIPLKNILK